MSHLDALSQIDPAGHDIRLCFYLDGCEDGSERLLRAAAAHSCFLIEIVRGRRENDPNAGRARQAAVAMGVDRLAGRDGLLLTTDADSRPAQDWVVAVAKALVVADVVAGRIVRHRAAADPGQSRIELYYDRLFAFRRRLDPVPWEANDTHHFGGGANIAVRASVYRTIGGFRPLPHAEDATFLDDAARAGFRVRRDAGMVVETSSRRCGRAKSGLASALRSIDDGCAQQVAHPLTVAWQSRAHAAARSVFATIDRTSDRAALGRLVDLTADHVLGVARDCPNAEAFAMRIVPACPTHREPVPLAVAEIALAELEAVPLGVAA